MQGKLRSVVVVLGILLLLLVAMSVSAQGESPAAAQAPSAGQIEALANGTTSISLSAQQSAAVLNYWTRERLAAATPMAMPTVTSLRRPPHARPPSVLVGSTAAGGVAAANADAQARAAYPQDWAEQDEAALAASPAAADGTPGVYTSYIVNQAAPLWKTNGHKPAGRLSFSVPGGTSYCSASVVSGNNIIVTAAHCVYDTTNNAFYNNWVFTPAYRNNKAPYGTFAYQTCWVLNSWINLSGSYNINSWAPYDVAVCKMNNNSAGQTLSSRTGWYGRVWNAGYIQNINDIGYPFQDYNLNTLTNAGKYLRLCGNETFQQAADVLGGGCNWGPGISGGPWLVSYDPFDQTTSYVNSVNSGLFVGQQNGYGARFNSNNIVVLCNSAGC
ncbi:MAG: trypsin-like serine protease [Candidatus Promineofilum sp.]|nr:trypsin-like serine protease [Promineifilum sp.]MCW5862290.1 trypsin-like serine protease [Anaerolineae bacterium]